MISLQNLKQKIYTPWGIIKMISQIVCRLLSYKKEPKIYLINIPSHGNLGDHLIAQAEFKFLQDHFPTKHIIPITTADLFFSTRLALSTIKKQDIICLTGGGFLGSIYPAEEQRFLNIVKKYKNKTILFPQTIFYEKSKQGKESLKRAAKIYQQHPNLYMIARDTSTFILMKEHLLYKHKDRVLLTPDIALYLNSVQNSIRNGVLLCMRNDQEKRINTKIQDYIVNCIRKEGEDITYTDTYVSYPINIHQQKEEVEKKIQEFRSAKLVITDRLHGMIYAAITGTPVIAFDNISNKISQVYSLWLSENPCISFAHNMKEAEIFIQRFLYDPPKNINNFSYKEVLNSIKKIIDNGL